MLFMDKVATLIGLLNDILVIPSFSESSFSKVVRSSELEAHNLFGRTEYTAEGYSNRDST